MFKLEISTANAAFGETQDEAAAEVARILRDVASKVEARAMNGAAFVSDTNGNRVGSWSLTSDEA